MEVTWVIYLLSQIISQDAVGAPRSIALKSEFISCCSARLLRIHHFVTFLMRTGEMCLNSRWPRVIFFNLSFTVFFFFSYFAFFFQSSEWRKLREIKKKKKMFAYAAL